MELTIDRLTSYGAMENVRKNPCMMRYGGLRRKLAWLSYGLARTLSGEIRPTEWFSAEGLKEKSKAVAVREMDIFLSNGTKPEFLFEGTTVSYSNETPSGIYDFASMIGEVILSDQYHAQEYLKLDSVVIDAGANVGLFSVFAGKLCPAGKVYAFEVAEEASLFLKRNTEHMTNVIPVAIGLGDREESIPIMKAIAGPGARIKDCGLPGTLATSSAIEQQSRITTLDRFVEEHGITRVDFIKIDTEGYEKQILRGAEKTIKRWKPVISAAAYHFSNDAKDIPEIILSFVPEYHYSISAKAEEDIVFYV